MNRLAFIGREHQIAADHHALGHRRVAAEAELGRYLTLVHLAVAGKGRLLTVERDSSPGERVVLKRPPHQPGCDNGAAVVREACCPRLGELDHLGQLPALLTLGDRSEEADRDFGLASRGLDQRAEHRRGVDDRLGVRHRKNRAVAAGCGRGRARGDRLLVLPARRAQVHVRVDEGRGEHEAAAFDHPVAVGADVEADLGDHAPVDADVEQLVDPLARVDHPGAADDQVVAAASAVEHHATASATSVLTSTGPWVSRS